jgi:hypothetical protein
MERAADKLCAAPDVPVVGEGGTMWQWREKSRPRLRTASKHRVIGSITK